MMSHALQLKLPFIHTPQFARDDFLWAESNEAARAWLARSGAWPHNRLALWGEAGSGKTHLLHLWARDAGATLIAGADVAGMGAGGFSAVAIDGADRCPEPVALLHLLNRCAEAGCPVLLAARPPPARWPVALPDLASRLRAITAVAIAPPEETLLRALLARLLSERQLSVPAELQAWLLLRLPRTAQAVREAVARLDTAGRRIDRRLAADVAAEIGGGGCEERGAMPERIAPYGIMLGNTP